MRVSNNLALIRHVLRQHKTCLKTDTPFLRRGVCLMSVLPVRAKKKRPREIPNPPPYLFRGRCQLGEEHCGHVRGVVGFRGIHMCPHRRHRHPSRRIGMSFTMGGSCVGRWGLTSYLGMYSGGMYTTLRDGLRPPTFAVVDTPHIHRGYVPSLGTYTVGRSPVILGRSWGGMGKSKSFLRAGALGVTRRVLLQIAF